MHSVFARSAASAIGVALFLTACSDAGSGPAGDAQVSVNLATRSATAAAGAAALSAPETYTDAGGNTLEIDRVQLVFREVELENETHQSACETASSSDGDCAEIEIGPFLVDLPLGVGGAARTVTASVPAGTYDEVKFKIREPDDDTDADAAFVAEHPDFAHASVKVEGSFNGSLVHFRERPPGRARAGPEPAAGGGRKRHHRPDPLRGPRGLVPGCGRQSARSVVGGSGSSWPTTSLAASTPSRTRTTMDPTTTAAITKGGMTATTTAAAAKAPTMARPGSDPHRGRAG